MPASARPLDLVPHRRYNPLLRQSILVSPQRTERPWQGEAASRRSAQGLAYDPACYLCPGNARSGGARNPAYTGVFAFDNDFPALLSDLQPEAQPNASSLLVAQPERGRCRVLCFHPNHSLTLARMEVPAIAAVVDAWAGETAALGDLPYINHVQIFENRGAMMGCQQSPSALPDLGHRTRSGRAAARAGRAAGVHGGTDRCLLCDYVAAETGAGRAHGGRERSFCRGRPVLGDVALRDAGAAAPPPGQPHRLYRRTNATSLAAILKAVTTRYDNLFQISFPYSLGFHQRPTDGKAHDSMHFHAHFYPPLLRSAEVRKFMVGFEMYGSPQRDLTPETAAERLRALPQKHYLD